MRALEITHELGLPDTDPLRTRILHLLGRPGSPDQGRSLLSVRSLRSSCLTQARAKAMPRRSSP
ncbi:hypothetical protein ADK54_30865 [Streptomyces sp. WM6378]|nr:hypothetical protein ADK54_30865 [Streptomyces sp. WM6378]